MGQNPTSLPNTKAAAEERYSRQILFSAIGTAGQEQLCSKHVLIIGVGALGTANAEILTRAGIGKLTIVDRDYIEFSNLQRQQLFTEQNARDRLPKVVAAKQRLQAINTSTEIITHIMDANAETLEQLCNGADLILDATDNFETRMIINDISQKKQIPWIYGACVASYGMSFTILPGETPCLHCLVDSIALTAATCDTAGVIAPAVQMTVAHQSAEALKILSGNMAAVRKKIATFDVWENEYRQIGVSNARNKDCPSCGAHPSYPFLQWENRTKTAVLCGRNTVQVRPSGMLRPNLEEACTRLEAMDIPFEQNPFLVSFFAENHRIVLFQDGRALVHDTNDTQTAQALYHRFIGQF